MRIVCESCTAEYNLDDSRIPASGMELKCPKCLHAFRVEAPSGGGQSISVPDAPASGAAPAAAGSWYILRSSGKVYGPFPEEEVVRMVLSGRIDGSEQVSADQTTWIPVIKQEPFATALAGINPAAFTQPGFAAPATPTAPTPPPTPPPTPATPDIADLPAPATPGGAVDLPTPATGVGPRGTAAFGAATFAQTPPAGGASDLPAPVGAPADALTDLPAPAGGAAAALPDLPAPVGSAAGDLPSLPAPAGALGEGLPDLPAPVGAVAGGLSDLPAPAGGAGAGIPNLPAPAGAGGFGLPNLPAPIGGPAAGLPELPTPAGAAQSILPAPAGGTAELPGPVGGAGEPALPAPAGAGSNLPAPAGAVGGADLPAPAGVAADPFAPPSSVFAHGAQDLPVPAGEVADPFGPPPVSVAAEAEAGAEDELPTFNPNVGVATPESEETEEAVPDAASDAASNAAPDAAPDAAASAGAPPDASAGAPPESVADWGAQSAEPGGASVADWLEEAAGDAPVEGEPVSTPDAPAVKTSKQRAKGGRSKKVFVIAGALLLLGGGGAFFLLGDDDPQPRRRRKPRGERGRQASTEKPEEGGGDKKKATAKIEGDPDPKTPKEAGEGSGEEAVAALVAATGEGAEDGAAEAAEGGETEEASSPAATEVPAGVKDPNDIPVDSYRGYQWAVRELKRSVDNADSADLQRARTALALSYRALRYGNKESLLKEAKGILKRTDDPEDFEEGRLVPIVTALAEDRLIDAQKELDDIEDKDKEGAESLFVQGELLRRLAEVPGDGADKAREGAFKALSAALKAREGFQRARFSMALLFLKSTKVNDAHDMLRKVLAKEPNHPSAALELAEILLHKREYEEAIKVLETPTDDKVENAPSALRSKAHELLARLLLRLSRGDQASKALSQALKFDSGNVPAMRLRAEQYRRKGQCRQMLKAYEDLQIIDKGNADTEIGVIKSLMCLGRRKGALQHVQEGAEEFKKDARFPYYEGLLLLKQSRDTEARAVLQKAQLVDPKFQPAVVALADLLAKQEKWAAAQASVETALVENPNSAVLHNGLGRILFGREKNRQAEAEYRKALDLDPELLEARSNLATLLRETGRLKEGLAEFKKVQDTGVDSVKLHFELGKTLQLLGQLDLAIEEYLIVLTQDERTPIYPYQAGTAYFEKGDYDKARSYFQLALQEDTKMDEAMFYIGMTYLKQNAYDEAVKRFQNASDLDRKNVKFQYWLAHTFRLQGKKVQAKELLLGIVKAIERNPLLETQAPDVWIELGLLYKSQNKLGKAIKYFKRGLGKHERRPLPWYETAEAVARLAQYETAIPLYERALKLDKDFGEAWFKLAQAYIQQKKPDYRKTTDACAQAIDREAGVCWCLKQMALIYDERRKCKKALKHYSAYLKQCGTDLPEDEFRELETAKIKLKRKCG